LLVLLKPYNMIRNLLLLLFISIAFNANAFQNDTTAYQLQRLKVNALLSERSNKFGQYDQSLDNRTGIFGFQTKGDIKKSNEILRQIVLNDNNIFKELKILLDYKDQEVKRVQLEASSSNSRIQNYMLSIKKLQDENQRLENENSNIAKSGPIYYLTILLLVFFAALSFFYYKKYRKASQGPFA